MAKGDKESSKEAIGTEAGRSNEQYSQLTIEMDQKRREKDEQSKRDRAALSGTLEGMSGTSGGLDPTVVNNIRGLYGSVQGGSANDPNAGGSSGGGGGGGGESGGTQTPAAPVEDKWKAPSDIFSEAGKTGLVDMEKMRAQIGGLEEMAKSGAIDPANKASIDGIIQKLKDFQFDPEAQRAIQGQINQLTEMGRTGGYDPGRLAQINADIDSLRTWSQTGGVDPERAAALRRSHDFMMGGGISAEDLEKWRGTGYSEFAKTGGWSDSDRADFRDRATSGIPAAYQQQMAEATRRANIQGGGGAGFLAAAGQANRRGMQDLATARRDAEVDLGSQVRTGRQWGIKGVADTEGAIQTQLGLNRKAGTDAGGIFELGIGQNRITGLAETAKAQAALEKDISGNRITATELAGRLNVDMQNSINDAFIRSKQGAGTLETNLADAIGRNRVAAQSAAAQAENAAQRLEQEGKIAGAKGLTEIAAQKALEAARAASNATAARANDDANARWYANFVSSNERWIGEQQQQGQQFATNQQRQLLGMDETLDRDRFGMDLANSWSRNNQGNLALEQGTNDGGTNWANWAALGLSGAGEYRRYTDADNKEDEKSRSEYYDPKHPD